MTGTTNSYVRRLLGAFRDTTPNPRAVPEDLLRLRPAVVYVLAPCDRTHAAESAARKLLEFGFERSELVLVSNRVHTLRPYADEDSLEVVDSLRVARQSGRAAGVTTGACFGALLGVLWAGVTAQTTMAYAVGAFGGGALGALLGVWLGRALAVRLRRRPDAIYDEQLSDDQILVGVGIGEDAPEGRVDDALRLLRDAGLDPRRFTGEDAPMHTAPGRLSAAGRA